MKDQLVKFLRTSQFDLMASQHKICVPIIERIYKKMSIDVTFPGISIVDDLIIDGHHRYLASLLANYRLQRSPGIRSIPKKPVDWSTVELIENDWDTQAKIEMLNEIDARYNGLTIQELKRKMT